VKALVIAGGRVPDRALLPAATFADVSLVVAADAGASACGGLGVSPDLVIGDLDSVDPATLAALGAAGVPVEGFPAEKDESDLELALRAAIGRGATAIVVLGALGGTRIEHLLSAVDLLVVASESGVELSLVDDRSEVRMLSGGRPPLEIRGAAGDFVSLFAWAGAASGVTTHGLRYPLRDEPLPVGPSRGLSNELAGPVGSVGCRSGRLLVVHTRRASLDEGGTVRGCREARGASAGPRPVGTEGVGG